MAPKRLHEDSFNCLKCGKNFTSRKRFGVHILKHKKEKVQHNCKYCSLTFKSNKKLEIHVNSLHRCLYCNYSSNVLDIMQHNDMHMRGILPKSKLSQVNQRGGRLALDPHPFTEIKAFTGFFRTYRYRSKLESKSKIHIVRDFFNRFKIKIREILLHGLEECRHIKLQLSLLCKFKRIHAGVEDDIFTEKTSQYFNSNLKIIVSPLYLSKTYKAIVNELDLFIETFEKNGSGWILDEVEGCDIRIAQFKIFKGGCCSEIPPILHRKGAIVNPKTSGNDCFDYAFLISMHGEAIKTHRERTFQYEKFKHLYDFSSIQHPTSLKQIIQFEKDNKQLKLAINVFGMEDENLASIGALYVMLLSKHNNDPSYRIVNIFYHYDHKNEHGHYSSILHFSRLINRHNCHFKHVCFNCLSTFEDEGKMKKHQELCFQFKAQNIQLPFVGKDGTRPTCSFDPKHYRRKLKANYVAYADLEALLFKEEQDCIISHKHVPCGYCFVIVDYNLKISYISQYRGMDAMNKFLEELEKFSDYLLAKNKFIQPMKPLSVSEEDYHHNTSKCHICELTIFNEEEKVRDHDHNTGLYRGPAHHNCNFNYYQNTRIPVVMHNFKNYDSNLLLSAVTKFGDRGARVIPQNSEKFISIICPSFYFVDSFMHMSSSLDTLVKNLHSKQAPFEEKFTLMCQRFPNQLAEKLSRKGVYPYEYMDAWTRFNETEFPEIEAFYNSLTGETVSQEDYDFGKSIFESECTNLGSYHDLYLLTDVLLLACVFENYREVGLKNFKLDPCYYFSLPGYSWDSVLFFTKIELDLLTDSDMYYSIELGLRGGVSMISHRHAEANNIYMESYDEEEEDSFLFNIDMTNLYGTGMLEYLPVYDFQWETEEFVQQLTTNEILSWGAEDNIGRILIVDLEYPKELHLDSAHNEYPLAPEKLPVSLSQISSHQRRLLKKFNIKYSEKQKKLIPHLGNRSKYSVHYRNLQFYIKQGLRVTKIHRVIRFVQQPWLREFILLCSYLRKHATDKFEKDFFKLIINSIFGRSMMNVRNREDCIICSSVKQAEYYTKRPNFKRYEILAPEVVLVFMDRVWIELDKPIYTAFTILDVTKMFMYEWHYTKIKKWYGNRATFLFTDTDSLAYHIRTPDLYKDLESVCHLFDFSEFPIDHPLYSDKNKKVMGTMRDESDGKVLNSFVGVSPKMYSFAGENLHKIAMKGVKKGIVKKFVTHATFMNVLFEQKKYLCSMNLIRSKKHILTTANFNKVAIHSFDSKRYILPDGISTLALNNYLIPLLNNEQ